MINTDYLRKSFTVISSLVFSFHWQIWVVKMDWAHKVQAFNHKHSPIKNCKHAPLTLAISCGDRAPCMSCLLARISSDAPDSLCHKRERETRVSYTLTSTIKQTAPHISTSRWYRYPTALFYEALAALKTRKWREMMEDAQNGRWIYFLVEEGKYVLQTKPLFRKVIRSWTINSSYSN